MIVGISGPYGSGKGVAVELLAERSFAPLSLSDEVRAELRERGVPETRNDMIEIANSIRKTEGPGALAIRAMNRMRPGRNYVVDSIRHPGEVLALRQPSQRVVVIWIDAPPDVRLERIRARGRRGDPESISELEGFEQRESDPTIDSGQRLNEVRDCSDVVVYNDSDVATFQGKLVAVLQKQMHFERPGWDEYFMEIAQVVARRSNCVKRHVASIITIDRRIISTGYNGTPRGVRNCHEGGCPRCSAFGVGGADLGECLCSHAEENAITQAAYHGVRVGGGTIYSTFCPCLMCTKMIINAGLREVVFCAEYPLGEVSLRLLEEAGVSVRQRSR